MRRRIAFMRLARRRRERPPRLSSILRRLANGPGERLSVGEVIEAFGDRAFGAAMVLFALPNVIPLPPGSSSVLGAPLIVIASQLVIGRGVMWLPGFLRRQPVQIADLRRLTNAASRYLRWTERVLSPRLTFFFGQVGDRIIGAICLALAIILFLPIPFGNMLPALAIVCFALALLERDGVAAIVGWVVSAIAIGVLVAVSGAIWLGLQAFLAALADLFG